MMAGLLLRASSCLVVASVGGRVANSVIRCFSRWVAEGGIALARIWPTGNRACCPQLPSKQIVPIFLSPPRAGISASYISYRSSGPCGASGSVWKLRHSLNGCRQGLLAVISSSRELDRRNKWLKTVVVLQCCHSLLIVQVDTVSPPCPFTQHSTSPTPKSSLMCSQPSLSCQNSLMRHLKPNKGQRGLKRGKMDWTSM
ncbi:uncharacterized protein IWZ02DRAFT_282096 [Phyllosticta citriasiana]|uniref:uncharacterized protein n=1 Tax=Phyllosticta citriasiana TaxID=595635 RepID=UPI0030FD861A